MLEEQFPDVSVIACDENIGIPAARNRGYTAARGDICVTLDDDATFESNDALSKVANYFNSDPALCCLSFQVKDPHGTIVKDFIPRRDRKIIEHDSPGAFFVGTGHAMHRKRFIESGKFWEELGIYFGEEPDLSYRILEAGHSILHTTSIAVIHEETPIARPAGRRIYFGTRNTPWIALKNLPWHCVISLTLLAWGYYFLQALGSGQLRHYFRGIADCIKGLPHIRKQRQSVSPHTLALLKRYSGVYWY
jgi:GT2 family glycosyltransferase